MLPLLLASLVTVTAPVVAVAPGYAPDWFPTSPTPQTTKVLVVEPCADGSGCEVWRWVEPEFVPIGYELF